MAALDRFASSKHYIVMKTWKLQSPSNVILHPGCLLKREPSGRYINEITNAVIPAEMVFRAYDDMYLKEIDEQDYEILIPVSQPLQRTKLLEKDSGQFLSKAARQLHPGDIICVQHVPMAPGKRSCLGEIAYIGEQKGLPGRYYGVRLQENSLGDTNGSVKGQRYFECEEKAGMFIAIDKVQKVIAPSPARDGKDDYFLYEEKVYVHDKENKQVCGVVHWCYELNTKEKGNGFIRCVGIETVGHVDKKKIPNAIRGHESIFAYRQRELHAYIVLDCKYVYRQSDRYTSSRHHSDSSLDLLTEHDHIPAHKNLWSRPQQERKKTYSQVTQGDRNVGTFVDKKQTHQMENHSTNSGKLLPDSKPSLLKSFSHPTDRASEEAFTFSPEQSLLNVDHTMRKASTLPSSLDSPANWHGTTEFRSALKLGDRVEVKLKRNKKKREIVSGTIKWLSDDQQMAGIQVNRKFPGCGSGFYDGEQRFECPPECAATFVKTDSLKPIRIEDTDSELSFLDSSSVQSFSSVSAPMSSPMHTEGRSSLVNEEIDQFCEKIGYMEVDCAEFRDEITHLSKSLKEAQGRIDENSAHCNKMDKSIRSAHNTLKSYIEELEDRVNRFDSTCKSMNNESRTLVESLRKDRKDTQLSIHTVERKLQSFQDETHGDIKALQRKASKIERDREYNQQKVMEELEAGLKHHYDQTSKELGVVHTLCQNAMQTLHEEQRKREDFEKHQEGAIAELWDTTVGKLKWQQEQIEELKSTVDELQSEASKKNEDYKKHISTLEKKMSALQEHNKDLEAKLKSDSDKIKQLATSLKELQPSWVIDPSELTVTETEIGTGGYAKVKVGIYQKQKVAVKILHTEIVSDHNRHIFRREMFIASLARHPNLLCFIGAVTEREYQIVTELMETSLRSVMENERLMPVDISPIAKDVACALSYLHSRPDPIIHRDVSSANVLLNSKQKGWEAKLGDFGSANFLSKSKTKGPGAPYYAAPESKGSSGSQTPKMDSYSFGILLYEMCKGKLIAPTMLATINDDIKQEECPVKTAIAVVAEQCIRDSPDDRPSMSELIENFHSY
jgi:hypothetical protein